MRGRGGFRMRSIVVVALVLAGCSSSTEGEAPLPACSSTFAGAWKMSLVRKGAARTADQPELCGASDAEVSVLVDTKLTKWSETNANGTFDYTIDAPTDCKQLGLFRALEGPEFTHSTEHLLFARDDGTLTGLTVFSVYKTEDVAANGKDATPVCRVPFDTVATRP